MEEEALEELENQVYTNFERERVDQVKEKNKIKTEKRKYENFPCVSITHQQILGGKLVSATLMKEKFEVINVKLSSTQGKVQYNFQLFKKAYQEDYNNTFFHSPGKSKIKKNLDNNKKMTMTQVYDYVNKKPNSKRAKCILNEQSLKMN